MPPKGKSKVKYETQKHIGQFSKNTGVINQMELKISEGNDEIKKKQAELTDLDMQSKELTISLKKKHDLVRQQKIRFNNLENQIRHNRVMRQASVKRASNQTAFRITRCIHAKRKVKPTTTDICHKAKIVRRNETMFACNAIHGGTDGNITPIVVGMIDTLTSKCHSQELSKVNSIKDSVHQEWLVDYVNSNDNLLRSLNMYYSHDVMGKRKYLNIRKANRSSAVNKKVPNFVSYPVLSRCINDINIFILVSGDSGIYLTCLVTCQLFPAGERWGALGMH